MKEPRPPPPSSQARPGQAALSSYWRESSPYTFCGPAALLPLCGHGQHLPFTTGSLSTRDCAEHLAFMILINIYNNHSRHCYHLHAADEETGA